MVEPGRSQMRICLISKPTRAQAHACAREPTPTDTEVCNTLLFQGNSRFVNAPQRDVTRTLPILFLQMTYVLA
jgi:hypothetical protein